MRFAVNIAGATETFEQYQTAMQYIDSQMAYWNNFDSHVSLQISVSKVPDENDIEVAVDDLFKVGERMGG